MKKSKTIASRENKDIYVKVTKATPSPKIQLNLSRLKEEYDKGSGEMKSWNVFSGAGIGASIGLIACLVSTMVGVPIASPEVFTLVGASLLFGMIAGFILY